MKKKLIIVPLTMLVVAGGLVLYNLPRGVIFEEYNDVMRVIVFDMTVNRYAYSFTLNRNNILTVESGIRSRRGIGTYLERLNALMNGTFLENNRKTFEIMLDYEEVKDLMILLERLEFCRMPRFDEFPDISFGPGPRQLWGVIFYFDRIHYGTVLRDTFLYHDSPNLDHLKDVINKIVELSGVNINL